MKWHAYRSKEPKSPPPRPFNHQEALDRIQKVLAELNQAGPWPENLTAWLQEHQPSALQTSRTATMAVDEAYLNQDTIGLEKALGEYKRAELETLTLWRNREQQP